MRYLMRAPVHPLDNMSQEKFILQNHAGSNIGNLLFPASIARTLMVDDETQIDCINTKHAKLNRSYAEYVNANYDAFLIPLANAIKTSFKDEALKLTKFIRMLEIPCHIIGVGLQTLEEDMQNFIRIFPYGDILREFFLAVLEKSPQIGVRGEFTAEYFKHMGFVPEKDFTIIGCPSMYLYGDTLPEVQIHSLTDQSHLAFNSKIEFAVFDEYNIVDEYISNAMKQYPNSVYLIQQIDDMRMMYLDTLCMERKSNKFYPPETAITFTDVFSWINYYREHIDFSFGSRIHGNVAAVLSGVPAITVPYDKRVLELSRYHNIPHIMPKELAKGERLSDIYERTDFHCIYRGHQKRFQHYIDFLHRLNLDTIYDHEYPTDEVPFDKIRKQTEFCGPVLPWECISPEERTDRYRKCFLLERESKQDLKAQKKELKEKLRIEKDLRKETEKQLKASQLSLTNRIWRKAKRIVK